MQTKYPQSFLRAVFSRFILSMVALIFVICTNFSIADDEVPSGVFKTVDGPNSHKLGYSDRDVIVLIHGWNPKAEDKDDKFGSGQWPELISVLKSRLSGTSWNLQLLKTQSFVPLKLRLSTTVLER